MAKKTGNTQLVPVTAQASPARPDPTARSSGRPPKGVPTDPAGLLSYSTSRKEPPHPQADGAADAPGPHPRLQTVGTADSLFIRENTQLLRRTVDGADLQAATSAVVPRHVIEPIESQSVALDEVMESGLRSFQQGASPWSVNPQMIRNQRTAWGVK